MGSSTATPTLTPGTKEQGLLGAHSVLGRPEEAKLTRSSHMHPPLPLG